MPFNVNSVSNLVMGFLIVNLFTILVYPDIYLKGRFLPSLKEKKIQLMKEQLETKKWKDMQDLIRRASRRVNKGNRVRDEAENE